MIIAWFWLAAEVHPGTLVNYRVFSQRSRDVMVFLSVPRVFVRKI